MVIVRLERDGEGRISSFTVQGHADYAEYGKDIVCAGVSAVTVGTLNAIEALLGVELDAQVEEGYLQASVPPLEGNKLEQTQLLLESMLVMLKSIEKSYGKHISVKD